MIKRTTIVGLCSVMLFGCAAEELPEGTVETPVYTETVVMFDDNGEETVTVRELTAEEARRPVEEGSVALGGESVAEAAQALTATSFCTNATLDLYDDWSYQGNRICFHHSSTSFESVNLANYCAAKTTTCYPFKGCTTHCWYRWDEAVRSFKSGSFGGNFRNAAGATWYFGPNQWMSAPPSVVTSAIAIDAPATIYCGNNVCDSGYGESCSTCPGDCGSCCGNGACDNGETCKTCSSDCGSCPCPNNPTGQPNSYSFCIQCYDVYGYMYSRYTRTETGCTQNDAFTYVQGTTKSDCAIFENACN